jgi:energy-coupling factor transport system substrate-specific component
MTVLDRRGATGSRWRTVDIVVASTLAVAFGVVFWAWGHLWNAAEPAFAGFPPARAVMYGVWLLPGVLGALIIRKPGAAVYTELVAAIVSALLGSSWGLSVVVYGVMQGLAPEAVFALRRYRHWDRATAVLAGAAAGAAAAVLDLLVYRYYPDWASGDQAAFAGLVIASSALIAGLGAWLLVRALAATGVLAPFAAGRDQRLV